MINSAIKTIGVIGTGVIGSSWALLFLSKGLRVVVTDPSPGAEQRLTTYLQQQWPLMQRTGLHENASLANYHFVTDIFSHINDIDLVQEVRKLIDSFPHVHPIHSPTKLTMNHRPAPRTWISKSNYSQS